MYVNTSLNYTLKPAVVLCRGEVAGFICWLVALRHNNTLVYLRDGSVKTIFTCCHTEIEAADPTFYLTQSQYTDTWPDPLTSGACQGSHWSANDSTPKKSRRKEDSSPGLSALVLDALTTRPTRQ